MARARDNGGSNTGTTAGISAQIGNIAKAATAAPKINRVASAVTKSARSSRSNYRAPVQQKKSAPAPRYVAPRPAPYSPPRPSVGNTSSGAIRASVPAPRPMPAPVAPKQLTDNEWLAGDTSYQQQNSAYEKALQDYAAQMSGEQGKYNAEYNAGVDKMGVDRGLAQTSLEDDYASRGLINSGVYGDAVNKFQNEWDTRGADLSRAKEAYMNDLLTGQQNFGQEQGQYLQKAKQDAMNRRADKYSL